MSAYREMVALAEQHAMPLRHRRDLEVHDRRQVERAPGGTPWGWILYVDGTILADLTAPAAEREAFAKAARYWPEARYYILEPDHPPAEVNVDEWARRVRAGAGGAR